MKPEDQDGDTADGDADSPGPIAGDVIGNTAYSERFVLKLLLKFANLTTFKEEMNEKSFEEDLCTLWDMTAERDVVLFLLKHKILDLFCFTMPVMESKRLLEIVIGILGNMCCQREAVVAFLDNETMLGLTFQYVRSDDSAILIQLLRVISSCLYLADDDELEVWLNVFENIDFATALYFVMKNSTNKDLLITALENFNTLCTYCNVEKFRFDFFSQFVTMEALDSVAAAFNELNARECETDETERIQVITLQLAMNLVGFDKSPEIYNENRENVVGIVNQIMVYYEEKIVKRKFVDVDIVDIIESTNTILNILEVSDIAAPDEFFMPAYNIWKIVNGFINKKSAETGDVEESERIERSIKHSEKTLVPLCLLMCIYMSQCTDTNLVKVLDEITDDYDIIMKTADKKDLEEIIEKRESNYRTRLKENVDS